MEPVQTDERERERDHLFAWICMKELHTEEEEDEEEIFISTHNDKPLHNY